MYGLAGRLIAVLGILVAMFAATAGASLAQTNDWRDPTLSPDRRADLLAAEMSFEQELRLFLANPSPPSPELGIPSRKEKDGCCGVSLRKEFGVPTTSLPKGVSLASTFSGNFARQFGYQIGQETWLTGFDGSTAPTADVARSPYYGRQGESFGEDPLLGGRLPSRVVRGVQTQPGVYSLAKHYIGNYQETSRNFVDEIIDQRTLREFYGRQWENIVIGGEPGAVMCAFQKVNGENACANPQLLEEILKGDWRFPGWVSSDFNACPGYQAFDLGADVCAPELATLEGMRTAVESGVISQARFEDMVHRVLRSFFAKGVIDNPPPGTLDTPAEDVPAGQVPAELLNRGERLARTIGRQGAVLLKNKDAALPLANAGESIAVIGPDADWYIEMFGSPNVPNPARLTTSLEGIEERADGEVTYTAGADPTRYGDMLGGPPPVPSGVLTPTGGAAGEKGLRATYYAGFQGEDPTGTPLLSRVEDQVNLQSGTGALTASFGLNSSQAPLLPVPAVIQPITAVYEGTMKPVVSGTYQLGIRGMGSFTVFVNGKSVVSESQVKLGTYMAPVDLVAGQSYSIRIAYEPNGPLQCCGPPRPNTTVRFAWEPPSSAASPQIVEAADAASGSDVAVVVADTFEGEAADRYSLELPQDQGALISAVAKANPNTVVVLLNGGPVTMPWIGQVPAVLEAWFAGEAQGKVIADLLFGDANPSGKLPVTFPATAQQPQEVGIENPESQFGSEDPTTVFDEGIFVGYRGYEERGVEPLFPFGHGLSYTDFAYRRLRIVDPRLGSGRHKGHAHSHKGKGRHHSHKGKGRHRTGTSWQHPGRTGSVRVLVRNTGDRAGTEIVQVYNGRLPAAVPTPPKQLLGWARVSLKPGQQRWVTVPVRLRTLDHLLAYWSTAADRWVTPRGEVPIYVGSSSRDIRLEGTVTVR